MDSGVAVATVTARPTAVVYGDWREDPAELETEVYYLLA